MATPTTPGRQVRRGVIESAGTPPSPVRESLPVIPVHPPQSQPPRQADAATERAAEFIGNTLELRSENGFKNGFIIVHNRAHDRRPVLVGVEHIQTVSCRSGSNQGMDAEAIIQIADAPTISAVETVREVAAMLGCHVPTE